MREGDAIKTLNSLVKSTPPPIYRNSISEWYLMASEMIIRKKIIIPKGLMVHIMTILHDPLYQKPLFERSEPVKRPTIATTGDDDSDDDSATFPVKKTVVDDDDDDDSATFPVRKPKPRPKPKPPVDDDSDDDSATFPIRKPRSKPAIPPPMPAIAPIVPPFTPVGPHADDSDDDSAVFPVRKPMSKPAIPPPMPPIAPIVPPAQPIVDDDDDDDDDDPIADPDDVILARKMKPTLESMFGFGANLPSRPPGVSGPPDPWAQPPNIIPIGPPGPPPPLPPEPMDLTDPMSTPPTEPMSPDSEAEFVDDVMHFILGPVSYNGSGIKNKHHRCSGGNSGKFGLANFSDDPDFDATEYEMCVYNKNHPLKPDSIEAVDQLIHSLDAVFKNKRRVSPASKTKKSGGMKFYSTFLNTGKYPYEIFWGSKQVLKRIRSLLKSAMKRGDIEPVITSPIRKKNMKRKMPYDVAVMPYIYH